MRQRMLYLLGGLLAVAMLAVGTSVATGDPATTGHAAGNGGGGNGDGSNCDDQQQPWSQWGQNWQGNDQHGRYWRGWGDGNGGFDGQSGDDGCSQFRSGKAAETKAAGEGKVARVMVAAKRLQGSRCQHLDSSGRLSRPDSCSHTNWMQAKGTASWSHQIRRSLPRAVYRLHHYAVDGNGNKGRRQTLHVRIR